MRAAIDYGRAGCRVLDGMATADATAAAGTVGCIEIGSVLRDQPFQGELQFVGVDILDVGEEGLQILLELSPAAGVQRRTA